VERGEKEMELSGDNVIAITLRIVHYCASCARGTLVGAKMYRRIGRTIAFLDRASEDARLAAIERRGKKGANLFRLDLSTFD